MHNVPSTFSLIPTYQHYFRSQKYGIQIQRLAEYRMKEGNDAIYKSINHNAMKIIIFTVKSISTLSHLLMKVLLPFLRSFLTQLNRFNANITRNTNYNFLRYRIEYRQPIYRCDA